MIFIDCWGHRGVHFADLLPSKNNANKMENQGLENTERRALLSGEAPDGAAESGPVVCACFQVGEPAIRARIEAGDRSVEALGKSLRCGTNCGSCIPELKHILAG